VYIVLDALDECPNTSGFPTAREEVLKVLRDLVETNLLVYAFVLQVTPGHHMHHTWNVLEPLTSLRVSLHDEIGQRQDILDWISNVIHPNQRMRRWRLEDRQLDVRVSMGVLPTRNSAALFAKR